MPEVLRDEYAIGALRCKSLIEACDENGQPMRWGRSHPYRGKRLIARQRMDGKWDLYLLDVKAQPWQLDQIRAGSVRGCDEGKAARGVIFAHPTWTEVE